MNQIVAKPIDQFRTQLASMESQFKLALPPQVTVEKFTRVILTAVQGTPDLLMVERQSLLSSCMKCAQDGLLPDGREAALVIYGRKAQYVPMVAGILKKVRNSGELASIATRTVYENDRFRNWVDNDGEHLEHEPQNFGDRGRRIGVYAVAKTKSGECYIEIMNERDVNEVKNISKSKDRGPWSGPFEGEMWRKTAIRRLSKRLPMSTDLEQVIKRDDELYDVHATGAATAPAPASAAFRSLNDVMVQQSSQAPLPEAPALSNEVTEPEATLENSEPGYDDDIADSEQATPEPPPTAASAPLVSNADYTALNRNELRAKIVTAMTAAKWTEKDMLDYCHTSFGKKPPELTNLQMTDMLKFLDGEKK